MLAGRPLGLGGGMAGGWGDGEPQPQVGVGWATQLPERNGEDVEPHSRPSNAGERLASLRGGLMGELDEPCLEHPQDRD